MKVNLFGDIRNGYVNIVNQVPDGLADLPENTHVVVGDMGNLDPILENNSVEEIILSVPMNVLYPAHIVPVLQHWKDKLKSGGKLVLTFVDIRRLGKFIHSGELSLQQIDGMVFGPNHNYHSLIDTNVLDSVLRGVGYSIKMISPKDFFVTVEASNNGN